jgi:hypothetical protein
VLVALNCKVPTTTSRRLMESTALWTSAISHLASSLTEKSQVRTDDWWNEDCIRSERVTTGRALKVSLSVTKV